MNIFVSNWSDQIVVLSLKDPFSPDGHALIDDQIFFQSH